MIYVDAAASGITIANAMSNVCSVERVTASWVILPNVDVTAPGVTVSRVCSVKMQSCDVSVSFPAAEDARLGSCAHFVLGAKGRVCGLYILALSRSCTRLTR